MGKTPESKLRANKKYNKKAYDNITLRVAKGQKVFLQDIATSKSQSLAGYIKTAINYYNNKHSIECPEIK